MKQKNQGILLVICSGLFFSFMTFFVRISGDLPTMQKTFFRNLFPSFVAALTLARSEQKFHIEKSNILSHAARSIAGLCGVICNFYAIDKLHLSDANMLNKLSPFFAIIFSYFVLKEKANKVEWGAVIIAFIGIKRSRVIPIPKAPATKPTIRVSALKTRDISFFDAPIARKIPISFVLSSTEM